MESRPGPTRGTIPACRTLGDAVEHWHASRRSGEAEIGPQFELNRFTRQWHRDHPAGTRTELRQAWQHYRAMPVEARPPIS